MSIVAKEAFILFYEKANCIVIGFADVWLDGQILFCDWVFQVGLEPSVRAVLNFTGSKAATA